MPPILQLDLQQIVSQALSFLLLLWVLKRFAWKPLLGVLDARRARIEDGLARIDQGKADLERLQQELAGRLAKIDDESRARIQQAVQEGRRIAMEIQDQARSQAQDVLAKSRETIELELAKAKVSLRDQLVEMTMGAVERIIQQKLDGAADTRLVESALEQLERGEGRG